MPYDLPAILAALQTAEPDMRLSAAVALETALKEELEGGRQEWEPLVAEALPVLVRAIGDAHKGVQVHAANCLQFLAFQSADVVPAMRKTMAEGDSWQAWGAALVMARMGYWFPEMGRALSAAMGAPDRDVRWAAAGFSLQLGRNHADAVDMVRATLQSDNPDARKMAAYCLGAMGQYAEVEDALAARLDDPNRDVRRAVVLGIDKLPRVSGPVQDHIAAMRQDADEFVRRTAAAVATKFGK